MSHARQIQSHTNRPGDRHGHTNGERREPIVMGTHTISNTATFQGWLESMGLDDVINNPCGCIFGEEPPPPTMPGQHRRTAKEQEEEEDANGFTNFFGLFGDGGGGGGR